MQWIAVMLFLSFAIGLRRRVGPASHAVLVLVIAVVTVMWYLQLGHSL